MADPHGGAFSNQPTNRPRLRDEGGNADPHGDAHANGSLLVMYMIVFGALTIFTAISFVVNWCLPPHPHGAAIIMSVAAVKAFLVALIFMHLKWDWSKLFFLIIPAFILGAMMMMVLMPDIVLGWHHEGVP